MNLQEQMNKKIANEKRIEGWASRRRNERMIEKKMNE
jgi:hypothetical protein